MGNFWKWTGDNSEALSVVLALLIPLVAGLWVLVKLAIAKISESSQRRFETYHKLIKELVEPGVGVDVMYVDRQIAAVYELRHFPKYYSVTKRILTGLKASWSGSTTPAVARLIAEIDLTISHIDREPRLRQAAPFIAILPTAVAIIFVVYKYISGITD